MFLKLRPVAPTRNAELKYLACSRGIDIQVGPFRLLCGYAVLSSIRHASMIRQPRIGR